MITSSFSLLVCPYCKGSFHIEKDFKRNHQLFAILQCQCDEFPVFDGIVYLQKDESLKNKRVVTCLRNQEYRQAFQILVSERKKLYWVFLILFYVRNSSIKIREIWLEYIFKIFIFLNRSSKDWYAYCLNRKKRAAFKICTGTLSVVKNDSVILDCCTGIGHFLTELNKVNTPQKNIGLDYSFKLLYLSRLFVSKKNMLVCSNLNDGLPFKENSVETIYLNDCVMYIFNLLNVFRDSLRVLKESGVIVANHIHALSRKNVGEGYSMTPAHLRNMAKDFNCYFRSDKNLFQEIKANQELSYAHSNHFKLRQDERSFSAILVPSLSRKKNIFKVKPFRNISLAQVDFTEDEDLQQL